MKYGAHKYADNTHWGETVSPFTGESSTTVVFDVGAKYSGYFSTFFSNKYFDYGYFGIQDLGASSSISIVFTKETPTTVVFT